MQWSAIDDAGMPRSLTDSQWPDPDLQRRIQEEQYKSLLWTRSIQQGIDRWVWYFWVGLGIFAFIFVLLAVTS